MSRFDVAIAGCGPAGLTFALRAAREGARVAVIGRPAAGARIEGASARVAALLQDLGLDMALLGPRLARAADWPGLTSTGNGEHLIDRQGLDAALLDLARASGVTFEAAQVRRLVPSRGVVELDGGGECAAALLVEARGRRAPVGPARLRGPATVALAGFVGRGAGPAGSFVAARAQGWLWRARRVAGDDWVQIAVDAADLRARGAGALWRALAGDLAMPATLRRTGCELRLSRPELEPGSLVLGDAAVAMDPLSGHGLFWALGSALAGVPMARAMIDGHGDLARRFHRERVVETFYRQARIGRDFHALAAPGPDAPAFWRGRAAWPDAEPAKPDGALAGGGSALGTSGRWMRRVIVQNGDLAERTVLATTEAPGGVAFVAGLELEGIAARLSGRVLPGLPEFAARVAPAASPRQVQAAHDWLARQGFAANPFPGTISDAIQEVTS
ncbi:MAG: hypothetical protein KDE02_06970 [Rhodobacteraceae bacterium]|nr:hypothetical protein [Paracoccaceae bacterium]MCC0047491.1 hypothetical protein [Defluviimonas sp.]MCP5355647.1 hypothetical protein [Paracoccaceae bacterium]MCP5376398.1 hypothetical protein [Paracoccaceae bacterium]